MWLQHGRLSKDGERHKNGWIDMLSHLLDWKDEDNRRGTIIQVRMTSYR